VATVPSGLKSHPIKNNKKVTIIIAYTTDSNIRTFVQTKKACCTFSQWGFQDTVNHYNGLSEKLNLQTLHTRLRHSDLLFLINIFIMMQNIPPQL
jgi:hypothetical protein